MDESKADRVNVPLKLPPLSTRPVLPPVIIHETEEPPAYESPAHLPPNWERKYDITKAKFFYVNHLTKKTQWSFPVFEPEGKIESPPQYVPVVPEPMPGEVNANRVEDDAASEDDVPQPPLVEPQRHYHVMSGSENEDFDGDEILSDGGDEELNEEQKACVEEAKNTSAFTYLTKLQMTIVLTGVMTFVLLVASFNNLADADVYADRAALTDQYLCQIVDVDNVACARNAQGNDGYTATMYYVTFYTSADATQNTRCAFWTTSVGRDCEGKQKGALAENADYQVGQRLDCWTEPKCKNFSPTSPEEAQELQDEASSSAAAFMTFGILSFFGLIVAVRMYWKDVQGRNDVSMIRDENLVAPPEPGEDASA